MEIIGNINTTESPITVTVPALLNAGGTPSILSDLFANQPIAGTPGRLFVATDTGSIFRDTGAGWQALGGSITITGTANQISVAGTTISIASDPIIPGTSGMILPSGTTAQRSGTPTAGTIRYNSTSSVPEFATATYGTVLGFNGIAKQVVDDARGKWKDDFVGGAPQVATFTTTAVGALGEMGWTGLNSTTAVWTNTASTANHPGILRMSTSATNNSTSTLLFGQTVVASAQIFPSNIEYFQWIVLIPTITTVEVRLGFGQSLTTANNGTAGIFFSFNPATNTRWQFTTRSGSTSTVLTSTAAIVAANTWYQLEAWHDGTTWRWAVNGVAEGASSTTNIPATALSIGIGMQTGSGSVRTLDIDYFSMYTRELNRLA